ncbi:choline/carnitine O-acyltransferase [Nakaseomyces bracarensis]|uniref:choline/carnitine O-acyltransferase n=1 Tax=Nakaseomyces bracarensis TaxID=273131 RepID=UPI003871DB85
MTVENEEVFQLQRLPIPSLEDTLQRFIERVEPVLNEKEARRIRTIVYSEENIRLMKQLHSQLIDYDKWLATFQPQSSYIEQFWYDSYLMYDSPLVLNVNPFFELENDPTLDYNQRGGVFQEHTLQIQRASRIISSTIKFINQIRTGTLKPDTVKNGQSLSMDQYQRLFGSSRIPPKPKQLSCHLQTDSTSHHMVVMYKGSIYWFDVLDNYNRPIFNSADEIEWNLYSIIMDREKLDKTEANKNFLEMGILTTESRRTWANIRQHIYEQPITQNWQNLKVIDSALFVLCLDDYVSDHKDPSYLLKLFLTGTSTMGDIYEMDEWLHVPRSLQRGTCINRWFDKLQIIVTKCGKAGINFEHTGVDGHTVLRLANEIYTDSITSFAKKVRNNSQPIPQTTKQNLITIPRKVEWIKDEYLSKAVHFAEVKCTDLISQYEIECLQFLEYGSTRIKSQFQCSPDAFVQQILQVAYYSLYRKFDMTYEPAMTKTYLNGRTEAIRPVTRQCIEFVKSVFNNDVSDKQRIALLRSACSEHARITRECSLGQGQDRHLYALQCICKTNSIPEPAMFHSTAWKKLNNNTLSTSNCGSPALKWFGFGPVEQNGFGIGYIIKDTGIAITVSSKHRQTKRYVTMIEKALQEINAMFNTK